MVWLDYAAQNARRRRAPNARPAEERALRTGDLLG